jgi:hypothetical protein
MIGAGRLLKGVPMPMPKENRDSMRVHGRNSGAVALQWYLRSGVDRWADRCALATSVALLGMRQSKMRGTEISEWKIGFQEGLGNLPHAKRILDAI